MLFVSDSADVAQSSMKPQPVVEEPVIVSERGSANPAAPARASRPESSGLADSAGQPLSRTTARADDLRHWPGAQILSVWEGMLEDGLQRRIVLLQPAELPFPVRIERIYSVEGELIEESELVANRLMVRVEDAAKPALESFARENNASLREIGTIGLYRVEMDEVSPDGVFLFMKAIERALDAGLMYAEADDIVRILATPNDPEFTDGTQWGLHNTGQEDGVADADIDAPEAWDIRSSAEDVIIAIVDTGLNFTHEDLRMWVNAGEVGFDGLGQDKRTNGIDDDGNGYIDDVHGINAVRENGDPLDDNKHGSHVGGTAAAIGNNGVGIAGVAWNAQLMGLKLFDGNGAGSSSDAIILMQYAIDHGAKVSNHSWAGSIYRQAMKDMIDVALEAGHLLVAASGNSSQDNDVVNTFPADYASPNIISVGAFDRTDALASFSNFGSGSVHLAAPGVDIYAPIHTGDSDYLNQSGTSMAAPHVTGAAALLFAQFPDAGPMGVKNRLLSSVRKVNSVESDLITGGYLNLFAALQTTDNAPYNDDLEDAHLVRTEVAVVRSQNFHATREPGEPVHESLGSNSVWFIYDAFADGLIKVDTAGSDFDTVVSVYTGTTPNNLTRVGGNDDYQGSATAKAEFMGDAETRYYIAVAGKSGAEGSITATFSGPPRDDFLSNPTEFTGFDFRHAQDISNATAEVGEMAHAGNTAHASIWVKITPTVGSDVFVRTEGSQIDTVLAVYTSSVANPTMGDLVLLASNDDSPYGTRWSEVTFTAEGSQSYWIAVDGKGGESGLVTVFGGTREANDDFANALAIGSLPAQIPFRPTDLVNATREYGEPNHDGADSLGSLWWSFTPSEAGEYFFRLDAVGVLALYTGTSVDQLTLVDSDRADETLVTSSRVTIRDAVPGQPYYLAVAERPDAPSPVPGSTIEVTKSVSLPNDDLVNAAEIDGAANYTIAAPFSDNFSNLNTGIEAGEDLKEGSLQRTAWYVWTPQETGTYVLEAVGSEAWALNIAVFEFAGSPLGGVNHEDLIFRAENSQGGPGLRPFLRFRAEAWTTYYIQIGSFDDDYLGEVDFDLFKGDPPVNDHLADALEVSGIFAQREFYGFGATREAGEPDHASTNWYYNDFRPHEVDDGLSADLPEDVDFGLWQVGPELEDFNNNGINRLYNTLWFKWTPAPEEVGVRTVTSLFYSSHPNAIMVYEADSSVEVTNYSQIQPILAEHPNPDRVPLGATTDRGWQPLNDTHKLFDSDPAYPGMYPPDPDWNPAYPDNRDPNWRPGSSSAMAEALHGEIAFTPEAGKTYYIVIGSRFSDEEPLYRFTIWQNPNDDFADAQELFGTDVSVTTTNFAATYEAYEPYAYVNVVDGVEQTVFQLEPGGRSVWYKWICPEEGVYTFDTYNSYIGFGPDPITVPSSELLMGVDGYQFYASPLLSVYASEVENPGLNELIRIDCHTTLDDKTDRNAKMAIRAGAGVVYYIGIDETTAPGAWGNNGFSYDLIFPKNGLDPTYEYKRAKSEWGRRAIINLNIKKGELANDDLMNAAVIPSDSSQDPFENGVYQEFVNLDYAWWEEGEPQFEEIYAPYQKSAWWKWTATESGTIYIGPSGDPLHHEFSRVPNGSGSAFGAATVAVFTGPRTNPTFDQLTLVTDINAADQYLPSMYEQGVTSFEAEIGQTYYFMLAVQKQFRGRRLGAYQTGLHFGRGPSNDNFADAIEIIGHEATVYGNNLGATFEPNEPEARAGWYRKNPDNSEEVAPWAYDRSIWWKWTAPGSGATTIDTFGTKFTNAIGVYTGEFGALTAVDTSRPILDPRGEATYQERLLAAAEVVSFNAVAGETYYIKVIGYSWDRRPQGRFTVTIRGQPGVPRAPTDFAFARRSASRVDFSWKDNALDESSYVIERSSSLSGPWSFISNRDENATTATDSSASQGFQYRLRAEGEGGVSDWVYLDATGLTVIDRGWLSGEVGVPFQAQLEGFGGTGNYTWQILSGQPAWMSLDPGTGMMTGTPPQAAPYSSNLLVRLSDGSGTADASFRLIVADSENISYADWLIRHGLGSDGDDSTGRGDAPEMDYVFGGDPNAFDGDLLGELDLSDDRILTFVFTQRIGTQSAISYEVSSDFIGWDPIAPQSRNAVDQGNGFEEVTLTFDLSSHAGNGAFVRFLLDLIK